MVGLNFASPQGEAIMNGNENVNMPYADNGYSYTTPSGFMGFFGGVQEAPLHYVNMGPVYDQESAYWSMDMNSYRYGLPVSEGSASYYSHYDDHHYNNLNMDFNRRAWEYPSMATTAEPVAVDIPSEENTVSIVHSIPDERSSNQEEAVVNQQVIWQDDVDPDNMTYEELLELGEAVGSESRGLSQELISLLPISKFKSGGIFSRKKSEERCVICQMRYKRGDRQINLPCKHAYHYDCGSKWLSINKTCPVCNTEVFGAELQQ